MPETATDNEFTLPSETNLMAGGLLFTGVCPPPENINRPAAESPCQRVNIVAF